VVHDQHEGRSERVACRGKIPHHHRLMCGSFVAPRSFGEGMATAQQTTSQWVRLIISMGALCACSRSGSSSTTSDAAPATTASAAARSAKTHAEIKGAIRHVARRASPDGGKVRGDRVVEAGAKGELDPIHAFWGSSATDVYAAAWDDPGRGLLHSKGDGVWT